MTMKSDEIKAGSNEEVVKDGCDGLPPSDTVTVPSGAVEAGVEATENPKRKSSWMKNIGSGMRTLRLRKHGSDKKNASVLNNLASASNLESDYPVPSNGASSLPAVSDSQHPPPPPQIPLPAIPTTSPTPSVEPSPLPSPVKALKVKKHKSGSGDSSSTLKSNSSRLSLREHVSKSKAKRAEAAAVAAAAATAGLNGSVPRDGSGSQKSSVVPTFAVLAENAYKADPARFIGDGLSFKAKLIGILEVSGPRGDRICQEALSELKMAVKAAGEHKQKVTVHVALDGLRVRDEKTGDCLYHHQVHKISFIAQDLTDTRAFGYIFGSPDTGHRFFGIKTEKSASQVVMSMRDLFQVVFDLKKKEIERAKQQLEMQQKFLATRAAETANRGGSSLKSGIAETYIDGACSLGGSPIVNPVSAPAEADLLNLEVELTSLQEGLDNIHSTLIDTATSHSSFNRGSTASISSDPMNPVSTTFTKYNLNNSFAMHPNDSGGVVNSMMRGNSAMTGNHDPFGDSFDPFDGGKGPGPAQSIVSPSFAADPFANVDPFAGTKFSGGLESSEFLTSDPFAFETPLGGNSFTFPDSGGSRVINRQVSITSNSSDMSSGKASIDIGRPTINSGNSTAHSPNVAKDISFTAASVTNWTASFDDNFASTNADESRNSGNSLGDLFTELDPLGTGRVRPFVDRKDFFQDLKNPPKKVLSEISATLASTTQAKDSLRPNHTAAETSSSPLPNSFSTNFNPVSLGELESSIKILPPSKVDAHLRTSSIRGAQLSRGDTPPSYSPPPPPPNTTASTVAPSVYFVSAPPKPLATPPSSKRSPQLLRNMTIASSTLSHGGVPGQSSSPKTLPRSTYRYDKLDFSNGGGVAEDIPNITPPPRPPHTLLTASNSKGDRNTVLPTALPRPHSGGEGRRQLSSNAVNQLPSTNTVLPPEPPPRPIVPSNEPVLPPPPLPPKKQALGPMLSNTLARVHYNTSLKTRGSAEGTFNDLPLPLPMRKGNHVPMEAVQQPRYAYPAESVPSLATPPGRIRASFDETDNSSTVSSNSINRRALPGLTMEAALNQVASLSLSQLAGKLQIPVDKLSSCTIQELAIKLTMMNLKKADEDVFENKSVKPLPLRFESNFAEDDDDFSTVSAPANVFPEHRQSTHISKIEENHTRSVQDLPQQYDRYAVFRELAESEAATSGFSICDSQETIPGEDEEDGQRSRTLSVRGSSSEKTLQADLDAATGNGLSTMDDITDANFSEGEEEEKSGLIDEVVELNLKAEWATFESNFDEQFVPLAATFSKSGESPWDSDLETKTKFGPTEIVTEEIRQVQKVKSPKAEQHPENHSSQFDFQLFEKPLVSVDPIGRRNSRGNDLKMHSHEVQAFQRQSSGSSKHSERSLGPRPASRTVTTTSDFSDSGKEKERSQRHPPGHRKGDEKYRTDSRNSDSRNSRRRYSREESDESSRRRKWRGEHYYDDEEEGSVSPVERRRAPRRRNDDEEYYSTSSRHSHGHNRGSGGPRHGHSTKYYSQSLHRKDRERFEPSGRRPSETDKYSNHESDFDDSYEDERRRCGRGSATTERRHRVTSRPVSSGGSGSGSRSHRKPPRYRDNSREYYHASHHRDRERRHSRDERSHGPYHHNRNRDDDYEPEGQEVSEFSEEEAVRRRRGRRRPHRDREHRRDRDQYYHRSPSWESETPPSGQDGDEGDGDHEMMRGTRVRRSDLDRPRDRDRDRDRPSSSSYHGGDRLDGSKRKASRYQSDQNLNANKSNPKLSVKEFGFEEDNFLPPSSQPQHPNALNVNRSQVPLPQPPLTTPEVNNTNSNRNHPNSTSNRVSLDQKPPPPPPESPFEDNFLTETNIFFPADFSSAPNGPKILENEESKQTNCVVVTTRSSQNGPDSNSSTGSLGKSDDNEGNSSPDINGREERNNSDSRQALPTQKEAQLITVVTRKPIISDTIHEVPDTEMKKSDSYNIFDREKDPFADDDFFT